MILKITIVIFFCIIFIIKGVDKIEYLDYYNEDGKYIRYKSRKYIHIEGYDIKQLIAGFMIIKKL